MNARIDSLPFARIALTIAIGCALAACGGGGGDSSSSGSSAGGARAQTGSDTHLADNTGSGTSSSGRGDGRTEVMQWDDIAQWGASTETSEADRSYMIIREQLEQQNTLDEKLPQAINTMRALVHFQGSVTDVHGVRRSMGDWIRHVVATCPSTTAMPDDAARARAHISCLAGVYEGIDSLTGAACRTTLKADGTVVHQNGSTTLPAFSVRPEHTLSFLGTHLGHPALYFGNYMANASFGQFFGLRYENAEILKFDPSQDDPDEYDEWDALLERYDREEAVQVIQENLEPANGPTMLRHCVVAHRAY